MKFKDYLKTKIKYIVGISLISSILSMTAFPILSTKALEPRFNFRNGDYDLLRARNLSTIPPQTVPDDPIAAVVGDTVEGVIYYHNGEEATQAINTTIRVQMPNSTVNGVAVLNASVSADNAATVTDTIVGNNIVGSPGLSIQVGQDADLEFIPGSVRWFKLIFLTDF